MNASERKKAKFTVLRKVRGVWAIAEEKRLCNTLRSRLQARKNHSEYLLIFGAHSRKDILAALSCKDTEDLLVEEIVGFDNPKLPWNPES